MKKLSVIVVILVLAVSCREKYEIILSPTQTSFLVVEGTIITNGMTNINLSRTTLLEERNILYENGATVTIQSDDNTVYSLTDKDSGRYELPFTNLNENAKYRLNIKTIDNREYTSEYVQAIKTPEVDTITWTRYNGGVEIYVNTKDPENNSPYYRFEYEEAWEFKSPHQQLLVANVIRNPPAPVSVNITYYDTIRYTPIDSITICWQFRNSTKILLGSTKRLSENRVYLPLVNYPRAAWELSYLYSINVKQYGISKEGYNFFQKMKKNTESLGTIFDAQPSELKGNFRCLTDTSEIIVGFVGATRVQQKRTFIDNRDLLDWNYGEGCVLKTIPFEQEELVKYFTNPEGEHVPIDYAPGGLFKISVPKCVDCTLRGTNMKPSFWP